MAIDDDDVQDWAIFGDTGKGWVGAVVFLVIGVVLAVCASQNNEECAKRACPAGTSPKVTSHECLCVTRPAPAVSASAH